MIHEVVKELERFLAASCFGAPVVAWMAVGFVVATGVGGVVLAFRLRRVRVTDKNRKEVQVELGLCACRDEEERRKGGKF